MARLITGIIFLPLIFVSIWAASLTWVFILLVVAAISLGLYEFWSLAARNEMAPDLPAGFACAFLVVAAFYFGVIDKLLLVIPAFTIIILARSLWRGLSFDRILGSTGSTLLGVLYVALLGSFLIATRLYFESPLGSQLTTLFFIILMGSDIAAYYIGRTFGRHKLAPKISPGKTWEGAIGGFIASLLVTLVVKYTFFPQLGLIAGLSLAALMNVLGVIGDLTESALKRGAGAKDAANILPGHGGLLDRLDSLLFNAPVIYYFGLIYFNQK
ncbi:MAG: phosphatidate cytidylyltransferase [Pyrinomonadaceae bacterium]